jgi:hypothetical protein
VAADRAVRGFVGPKATDEQLRRTPDADAEAELAEEVLGAEEMFVERPAQLPETETTLEAVDAEEAEAEALAEAEEGEEAENGESEVPELFADEVEPELDEILRRRTEVGLEVEPPLYVSPREIDQLPAGPGLDEFVCSSCHLVRRRTQLADTVRLVCRDCVNNER